MTENVTPLACRGVREPSPYFSNGKICGILYVQPGIYPIERIDTMGKKILPALLALLGGGAGFALRKWQLATGFEADTALAIPGAPAAMVMIAFSACMALLFFFLCRKENGPLSWESAFAAGEQNTLAATALILSAMLLLVSGGLEIMEYMVNGASFYTGETAFAKAASRVLPPLRIVLCLGSLPCVFFWSRAILQKKDGKECLSALEPCILYCVWLISTYQSRAADPVVQDYLYEVFAIVTALLGFYFIAGFSFENGKPRQAVFFCLMGIYFSLVTLADRHGTADLFRHLFAVVYLTAHVLLILNHPPEEQEAVEEKTEADDHA